jgi:hypothetical protein
VVGIGALTAASSNIPSANSLSAFILSAFASGLNIGFCCQGIFLDGCALGDWVKNNKTLTAVIGVGALTAGAIAIKPISGLLKAGEGEAQ